MTNRLAHWRHLASRIHCTRPTSSAATSAPRAPSLDALGSQDDMKLARAWIEQLRELNPDALPRDAVDVSYSRSSGPGGQNVNKVSTKATVRLLLNRSKSFVPAYAIRNLSKSPYAVKSDSSGSNVLVSSSAFRTQPENLRDCFAKLKSLIIDAAQQGLVGETSVAQKQRVKHLAQAEKQRVKAQKKQRKDVKGGRRAGKGNFSLD
ncbi:hypothetical protein OIV83_005033 [Microbotryomycetes sp. JL201]|nr:hypothetical protein OIV83_005033 [Microbotryomycetes sp. JL201]